MLIMKEDLQTGLVLEGGGMRGIFTAGVLDFFMDHQIEFPYTIGVSAGATNGLSYISKQRGRSYYSDIDLLKQYNYIGFKNILKGQGYIDLDFLFYEFPKHYYPFDFNTFKAVPNRLVIVTSNCLTGKAEYFEEKEDYNRLTTICKASCSLPVMCPITFVDQIPMVDGGVCDAIPIKRAIKDGFNKNVIVLTRNKGYRKSNKDFYLPPFILHKYPAIQEQLRSRYKRYNKTMDFIEAQEAEGKAIIIRPIKPIKVTRTEKDSIKLRDLYMEGYNCAEEIYPKMMNFCRK